MTDKVITLDVLSHRLTAQENAVTSLQEAQVRTDERLTIVQEEQSALREEVRGILDQVKEIRKDVHKDSTAVKRVVRVFVVITPLVELLIEFVRNTH